MIIYRYNITVDDIFRGVNDTTSSAVKTGVMLAGGRAPATPGTTCHMHAQELVMQHALGLRQRTKNKEVIDSFEEGRLLCKKVKILSAFLMNKRAKNRFQKYKQYIKDNMNVDVNRIVIPNETRMSGVYYMYESILRAKDAVNLYCKFSPERNEYTDLILTETEWQLIAETLAILKVMNTLALTSQKQSVDSNCYSYYNVAHARYYIKTSKQFKVFNLFAQWAPTKEAWGIPTQNVLKVDLLPQSRILIDRLVKEFDHYFPKPDSDQILMMIFNPVFHWSGFT
jgi:hypothetical protein